MSWAWAPNYESTSGYIELGDSYAQLTQWAQFFNLTEQTDHKVISHILTQWDWWLSRTDSLISLSSIKCTLH